MNRAKHVSSQQDDIAIIGMACHFPGAASLDDFWMLLNTGSSSIQRVPEDRWNSQYFIDKGEMKTQWGGFIEHIKSFDARFFNISAKEARFIDPQQRLLLQVVWHALENAGIAGDSLKESKTGVYTGCATGEYFHLLNRCLESKEVNVYVGLGNSYAATSGRIAYFLGTQGPAITIDTACSSSMVSAHLACQDLLMGTTNMAIISGVSLLLNPFGYINFSRAKMLSPDGQCKTFDQSANGYVRSEGIGSIVCKRLADAHRDGDRIWGVIKGSAVNQDGMSNGFSAPNGQAQVKLYQQALASADKQAEEIDWIECHGTGTKLGDPIEVDSIQQVYANKRKTPLYLSSVKTNIGHLEATAGIASIIKVALSLKHRRIPAHLNYQELNPFIKLDKAITQIPTTTLTMDESHNYHVGVSSFGITGTNSHLIMAEVARQEPIVFNVSSDKKQPFNILPLPLPLSAVSDSAFGQRIKELKVWIEQEKLDLNQLCAQMWIRQSHFPRRLCLLASTTDDLIQQMEMLEKNQSQPTLISKRRKIAFLFAGQPEHLDKILKNYQQCSPFFRAAFERCVAIIEHQAQSDLSVLCQQGNSLAALFSVEYALAQMWIGLGLKPSFLTGDGAGEYVVAVIAEVISLPEALQVLLWMDQSVGKVTLEQWGRAAQPLIISVELHKAYADLLDQFVFNSPKLRIVSSMTGEYSGQQNYDKAYFVSLLTVKSNIQAATGFLHEKGVRYFLNMGAKQSIQGDTDNLALLDNSDPQVFSQALKQLYEAGFSFKNAGLETHFPIKYPLSPLPLYPFDKQEHWFSTQSRRDLSTVWTETWTLQAEEYTIFESLTVIPHAFYVALALLTLKSKQPHIATFYDVAFLNSVAVAKDSEFLISAYRNVYFGFLLIEISVNVDNQKIILFSSKVSEREGEKAQGGKPQDAVNNLQVVNGFYEHLDDLGLAYAKNFQMHSEIRQSESEIFSTLTIVNQPNELIKITLLIECLFQLIATAKIFRKNIQASLLVPRYIQRIEIKPSVAEQFFAKVFNFKVEESGKNIQSDLALYTDNSTVVLIQNLCTE